MLNDMLNNNTTTVGILTSGGDAPGMNAAVRAVVRCGLDRGYTMLGIQRGYTGLIYNEMVPLHLRSVSDIIQNGGTVLFSSRCPEFTEEQAQIRAVENCRRRGIDALVVIGGDGSFRGARELTQHGIPCIGIPGTIDNDIAGTEYTIGFDTAVNTVVGNVDRLRDTSQSHDRCSVVEVMGRRSGHIALYAGISCGALAILVPERPFKLETDVIPRMLETMRTGKHHFIIMVAEGAGSAISIAKRIEEITGITTTATVLGYVQRGGSPSAHDRMFASWMGAWAIELIESKQFGRVVVVKNGRVTDLSFDEALSSPKTLDMELYSISGAISI